MAVLEGENAPCLVVELRKTPSLIALQRSVYNLFADRDLDVGNYSRPSRYKPHVTLGTLVPGTDTDDVPAFSADSLHAREIVVQRPEYQTVRQVSLPDPGTKSGRVAPSSPHGAAISDLRRYENKLLMKGIKSKFNDSSIPGPVMFFLRADLDGSDGSPEAIKAAVDLAARTIQENEPQELADFLEYWDGIDQHASGLVETLGDILSDPELLKELARQIEQTGDAEGAVNTFFDAQVEKQVERLVGTPDAPGPLTAIVLAGVGRGEQLLTKLDAANQPPAPKRHTSSKAKVTVDVGWQMLHDQALSWARSYAYDLVRGINQSTTNAFRTVVSDWVTKGGGLPGLVDMLQGRLQGLSIPAGWSKEKLVWATSRDRARVIAQTESARAFHEGNKQKWQQAGVQEVRFKTQADRLVCKFCRDMKDAVGTLAEGWAVPTQWQSKYGPRVYLPCHIGGRCYASPVAASRIRPALVVEPPTKPQHQSTDTIAVGTAAAKI
jgi:hypothetical protein